MSSSRIIFHVDIDSFYPSVEVRENPQLKALPVIIGADPKEGKGRGVVVSSSYEARKFGIRSGQPISRAYKLCPQGIFLRPNFHLYGSVSEDVMDILRSFAGRFEQVSIDEAFLDVTDKVGTYGEAKDLATKIKEAVLRRESLTCSIGIAPNKSSAKIASELGKPNGLKVVEPSHIKEFLAPLSVSSITGVGKKTARYLKSIGVDTIGQLQAIPGKDLVKYFGKGGVWLWGVAHGLEEIEVRERRMMKSVSVEHTFEYDVDDEVKVHAKMEELAEDLHRRILTLNLEFKKVGIKVRFQHFQTYTREHTLPAPTNKKSAILEEGQKLFHRLEKDRRKIRLIGLRVSDLRRTEPEKRGLDQWIRG